MTETSRQQKLNLPLIVAFNTVYMAAAVLASALQGNREFVFYIVVMLVIVGVFVAIHRQVPLTQPLLWAFSVWGLLHMGGGLCPVPQGWAYQGEHAVLYSLWLIPGALKYDQVVHAYGFGVTTWLCWHLLKAALRKRGDSEPRPTVGLLTLCAAAGMGFGAFNEVVEFAAVLMLPNTNVGGYINTGWDLVANLSGAVTAAIILKIKG